MDFHDARTCVIFGAGDYYDETPAIPDDAFVVAADGGLGHAPYARGRSDGWQTALVA